MKKNVKYFFICLIVTLVSCKSIQLRNEIDNYYQKKYLDKLDKNGSKFRKQAINAFFNEFEQEFSNIVIIEEYDHNLHSPALGVYCHIYFVVDGKVRKKYVSSEKEKFEEAFHFVYHEEILFNLEEVIYSKLIKGEESDLVEYKDKDQGLSPRSFMYATQIDKSLKIINGVKFTQFYFSKEYYENKILKE